MAPAPGPAPDDPRDPEITSPEVPDEGNSLGNIGPDGEPLIPELPVEEDNDAN